MGEDSSISERGGGRSHQFDFVRRVLGTELIGGGWDCTVCKGGLGLYLVRFGIGWEIYGLDDLIAEGFSVHGLNKMYNKIEDGVISEGRISFF